MTTWKSVPGFEGLYEVARDGQVRSLYWDPPHAMTPHWSSDGRFLVVGLRRNGAPRPTTLARMVAGAFLPPPPDSRHVIEFKNGDRTDCRASNLRWAPRRCLNPARSLTPAQVRQIRKALSRGVPGKDLAKRFGVGVMVISNIRTGRTYRGVV